MSKSIWIFNHYAITPDMTGGSRHYDLSKELVKRGYDVTIFASSFHYSRYVETKLSGDEGWKIETVDGIRFVWLKTPAYQRNDWRRIVNMLNYTYRSYHLGRKITQIMPCIPKPDTIIGSTVHLLAVFSAYCIARFYRAKFIMEVRDLWPQTLIDIGALSEKALTAKAMYALEKFLYQKAGRIITLLPLAGEYMVSRGVSNDKIVWLPNGVDLSRYGTDRETRTTSNGHFKMLYLGAHGRVNALDNLIDAAHIVQDRGYEGIQLIFVGDGPEKPGLIKHKEKLNLKNVEFHDSIPKSEVPGLIASVDACLVTLLDLGLYKYGLSFNKIFDYLAAGKPIIMGGSPVNDIIKDADCGFSVPPDDSNALANAMIALYEMSAEERLAMGRRGRGYVEKYHDTKVLAERLIGCVEAN
ncbi:glycosyltransferase family 4 protein [Candidatus Poribacteria bacterium]